MVEATSVYTDKSETNGTPSLSKDYKAIVRKDTGKLIAIQRRTYKLVPNSEVIKPLMEELHKLDTSWYIDSSHSFVDKFRKSDLLYRHTSCGGRETWRYLTERLPVIKNRILSLQETKVTKDLRADVDRRLGKRLSKYVDQQESEVKKVSNQWALYNILTYYISHMVKQPMRADYQMRVSKLFGL